MENLFHYIYSCVGILVGLYIFITRKEFRKSLLMLLLSAFFYSGYIFYFVPYPFNFIGTLCILVLWFVILQLVKKFISGKEQVFWYVCILYVAINHFLHYIFDPLAEKNIWYAGILYIYTNVGLTSLAVYYFIRIYKKK
ncbi:hypothetical protein AS888_05935 [Peribacillus simplex]|uniref:Uncharacterized protein n=1 Tax=Peribacillus simplex TaxID=1478 RepID=A0A109N1Z1_9BACI|nr:hypothetical protein AS888_05935 [Peribacillus simplex]